jgi:hypothetical protein
MQLLPLPAPSSTAAFKFGVLLLIALMAANCATAAPAALGTPLDQALTAVDPSLVSETRATLIAAAKVPPAVHANTCRCTSRPLHTKCRALRSVAPQASVIRSVADAVAEISVVLRNTDVSAAGSTNSFGDDQLQV